MGVHTCIAYGGDNWQTLTNVMEKKGTMAAHTLELPSPDVRRWDLKQAIPVFFNVRDIIIIMMENLTGRTNNGISVTSRVNSNR